MSAFGDLGSATGIALREFHLMLESALVSLVSLGVDKARIDLARDTHSGVEWIRVDGMPRFKASIEVDNWTVTVRGEWIGEMPWAWRVVTPAGGGAMNWEQAVELMRIGYAVKRRSEERALAIGHSPDAEVMDADTGCPAVLYGSDFVATDWERYHREPETERFADEVWADYRSLDVRKH